MKIKNISLRKENLELTRPYTIAYKTVSAVENIILELELENGITGLGACNPSKYVVGIDNDDVLEFLTDDKIAFLFTADIRHFYSLLEKVYTNFADNTGARVLFDVALHDAFTQYLGVSLSHFYGVAHRSLPTSVTIGISDIEDTIREAKEFLDMGFRYIKVKLGKSLEEDIERLKAMRKDLGHGVNIRIDANQGWTKQETISFFEQTVRLEIELVEQPVPVSEFLHLFDLPEGYKLKIAADESLKDASDAETLSIANNPAGIFNIKLMKCGGILEAIKIADIAHRHHKDLMWGCNDESIISISAALHVALSRPHTRYLDLDGSFDLARDVVSGGFVLDDGMLSIKGGPGLGVSLL